MKSSHDHQLTLYWIHYIYFEVGKDSCKLYTGGNSDNDFRFINVGFTKIQETLGDESVNITFPNLINVDSTNTEKFFKVGTVSFSDTYSYYQTGYAVSYTIASCDAGTCHNVYRSCYGEQENSYIRITNTQRATYFSQRVLVIDFEINCKLYSPDGKYYGQLEGCETTVILYY